ncbi:PREDICTED: probable methyltransferase PMT13 [Populus euphratica]|uniref:Methyltransferase n=1 Tax=Populus euphratica TaxID=75702 RepID=A0AAJ6UTM9_POPEU|nr:PREDICTED: probable methyltransferase PMT13 [Populus euphratica]
MGHLNLPASKRNPRQWKLLDLVTATFFGLVFLFFLLVFTPLGDSLAASGRQTLLRSTSDPRQRHRLVALIEAGHNAQPIEACPADEVDHMPCEDPRRNSQLSREMNFYRERHCPPVEDTHLCLIPPPDGYKISVQWPQSLHKIWHANMPHDKIADRKGHQGWMKKEGEHFIFPGGGTMFPEGAVQYIEKLGQYIPIKGGVLRTALDMGCGVASWGGYLLKEGILTLSFAPRDSHKAQIQFALERGVPAFVAMLGTRRLPYPAFSFDLVHCSRCLIPFTAYNASYFIEVNRLLRPGGYLVISGPPVQWAKQDKEWADLQAVARALCYELIAVDGNTVIWKKPAGDLCLSNQNEYGLELCDESDDPSDAWYFKLKKCVSRTSAVKGDCAIGTIPKWPDRLMKAPSRAVHMKNGLDLFDADTRRWVRRVAYYKNSLNVKLGTPAIRNVMDMNAFFGSFAAALMPDPVWVMNVVPARKPSTLGVIYDRGLIGVYHDWCEPFSTYPRSYDLIHVAGIESLLKMPGSSKNRCNLVDLMVEMDRILRPEGTVIIRDSPEVVDKVARVALAVRWLVTIHEKEPESSGREKILVATKSFWKLH